MHKGKLSGKGFAFEQTDFGRRRLFWILVIVGTALGATGCADHSDVPVARKNSRGGSGWPAYVPQWQALAAQERALYLAEGYNYSQKMEPYSPHGSYFKSQYDDWKYYQFDSDGFPLNVDPQSPNVLYYNPVTTGEYALSQYALYLLGTQDSSRFLQSADHLISLMGEDGAFRYPIEWKSNGNDWKPGWVSGLAQGRALSVFARAWALTADQRYTAAGKSALAFMLIPTSEGGTRGNLADLDPSLSNQTTFEEMTCHPTCTILNGYLFALVGLYDWATITNDSSAQKAYDLRHVIADQEPLPSPSYHMFHIVLADALYAITASPDFGKWRDTWEQEVNPARSGEQSSISSLRWSNQRHFAWSESAGSRSVLGCRSNGRLMISVLPGGAS